MLAPERRSRGDLLAASVIAAVVVVTAGMLWWNSDARGTTSMPAASSAQPAPRQPTVPTSLEERWRAPSGATASPVVDRGIAITADGEQVTGRSLATGEPRWSYRRDLPLCAVDSAFSETIAVYRRGELCSEVTTLTTADGRRAHQRTGPVEAGTGLEPDTALVAATGRRYVEVWRTDLVRTLAYGALPTPVRPNAQPRPHCTYGSMTLAMGLLAMVERCPDEEGARLTVQQADPEEADQPEVDFSTTLPTTHAQVVAASKGNTAVALSDPPRLRVVNAQGRVLEEHPLPVPDPDLRTDPAGRTPVTVESPQGILWFTGSSTVALDPNTLRPRWTFSGSLGPGVAVDGRLLLPVPDGLAVVDPATGAERDRLAVDRAGHSGPVRVGLAAELVIEQRGDTVVALGPAR